MQNKLFPIWLNADERLIELVRENFRLRILFHPEEPTEISFLRRGDYSSYVPALYEKEFVKALTEL